MQFSPMPEAEQQRFMPLVRRNAIRIANRCPRRVAVTELISVGWVGLLETLARGRGSVPDAELDDYVACRVRGAMLDHLRACDPATRRMRDAARRLAGELRRLTQALGRRPDAEEIAIALGLTLEDYYAMVASATAPCEVSVDATFECRLASPAPSPEGVVARRLLAERVAGAIEDLPERLQQLMVLLYQHGCSQKEAAEVLRVGPARICQLHSEAVRRLRAELGAA